MGIELANISLIELERLGRSIPADTPHAVSVSLPTWRANVAYEEGEDWVVSKMKNGYPRFFIDSIITSFAQLLAQRHGLPNEQAMLFSTPNAASRCIAFILDQASVSDAPIRTLDFVRAPHYSDYPNAGVFRFSVVLFPKQFYKYAKSFWQHTGEGVSSRRAEYCRREYEEGHIVEQSTTDELQRHSKGPRRYRKVSDAGMPHAVVTPNGDYTNGGQEMADRARFLEERFGRNLNLDHAEKAKLATKRRIAGCLTADTELNEALTLAPDTKRMRDVNGFSEDDIYLYPCGMNAIYNTHRKLLLARGARKSICFGFPYIDTLKVLEKFGPGCLFYGFGTSSDLDDLEKRLRNGERFLALFCEFPSNPLLRSPDLRRIRALANEYDFAVVVDETVGNFLNVHVLPHADVVVSSLTKVFSGDSNVMGGCAILNPKSPYYDLLKNTWTTEFDDTVWPEDAIFVERNSRDFVSRIERININADAICERLRSHSRVKAVYYPKTVDSKPFYDACRTPTGGYGGLLSATFFTTEDTATFFDNLDTEKGPSLGTNFTLASPFVLLAHYTELEWAARYGAEKNLVRFSVGLEDTVELLGKIDRALSAIDVSGGRDVDENGDGKGDGEEGGEVGGEAVGGA